MPLSFKKSANIARMRPSATLAVAARARTLREQGRQIIDLGAGEPDFDTPAFIRQAAALAIEAGHTRYTPAAGIPELRQAIALDANRRWKPRPLVTPEEVIVSTGSKQCLFNACMCCFGPGDEVLVPGPAWTSYTEMIGLARATAVHVPGDPANSLKTNAKQLAAAATERTRGLIINSPINPTGAVYAATELSAILDLAAARGWWVIADEIYIRIAWGAAPSAFDLARSRENLIVVNGVAKAWAMTGWRIGWAIAPAQVTLAMTALQSHSTSNACSVSQYAALAALSMHSEADKALAEMLAAFRERRDLVLDVLRGYPEIAHVHPEGAFYVFLNVAGFRGAANAGTAFAEAILEERDVAVVPGSAFGAPDWIRMSYANSLPVVAEGIARIASFAAHSG